MLIEAVWIMKLLWMIFIGNVCAKALFCLEKSRSVITENALRPLAYLTFPARIINHVK